jgi:hypothetical protein
MAPPASRLVLGPKGRRSRERQAHGLKRVLPCSQSVERCRDWQGTKRLGWLATRICDSGEAGLEADKDVARSDPSLNLASMRTKTPSIEALIESHRGQVLDAYYLAFFHCFNRRLYFQAHEVLEVLWLRERAGPSGAFYKGLIQLAGAFVHLQKGRPGPAGALFRLAETNLSRYGKVHEHLDVRRALGIVRQHRAALQAGRPGAVLNPNLNPPQLALLQTAFVQS